MNAYVTTWGIAALATAGVIVRPWRLPEAIWAAAGALLLIALGLLPWRDALSGAAKGLDVCLFLAGMMLLAELARLEGLFDWLASLATRLARGSPARLFVLVYGIGIVVTTFLSNDATAVVLTPAVYAACKAARVRDPLPYLLICAFIANAASFVLPISNPANLVVFGGGHLPPLMPWLARFALPSLLSIAVTYLVLRWTQRRALAKEEIAAEVARPDLSWTGRIAGLGIVAASALLLTASAFGRDLGLPTFIAGVATSAIVLALKRAGPWDVVKDVSWGVLPLVLGLFVLVEALDRTGAIRILADWLSTGLAQSAYLTALAAGLALAFGSNVMNNLPAGLIAGSAIHAAHLPPQVAGAVLIGVDLGPNLSVTGSLATILWLAALRREGVDVGAWRFLKLGALVMPPAFAAAATALLLME